MSVSRQFTTLPQLGVVYRDDLYLFVMMVIGAEMLIQLHSIDILFVAYLHGTCTLHDVGLMCATLAPVMQVKNIATGYSLNQCNSS